MSLLERIRRLIASNVNALFEKLADPGAAIDELIANMETAAREAREQVMAALTEDKRAQRLRDTTAQSVIEWGARAARAASAGDDALAKEALARRAELENELATLDADRAKGRVATDELTKNLRELDAKIGIVKARKETLKEVMRARARGGGAADRYDDFVKSVDVSEAEVQLGEDLGAHDRDTERVRQKIEDIETNRDVDDRLAALKAQMNKK